MMLGLINRNNSDDTPTTKVGTHQQSKATNSQNQEVSRTYSSAPFIASTCVIAKYRGTYVCVSAYLLNQGYTWFHSMRLQVQILVMNFTISIQLNMFHQCQLGTNFSLDFPSQIKIEKHFQRNNQTKMDWSYLFASTYIQTFEPRG